MKVRQCWIKGVTVAENSQALFALPEPREINNFQARLPLVEELEVKVGGSKVRVIEVVEDQLLSRASKESLSVETAVVASDPNTDRLKVVVLNRYQAAPPVVAFVRGFGLKKGAMASTIAHDSHNIIAVGVADQDIQAALALLVKQQGGIVYVAGDQQQALSLPIAGLMASGSCEEVAASYQQLEQAVRQNGCHLKAPFMNLSFLALPVIPSLKITDKGLFDVESFSFTDLFI